MGLLNKLKFWKKEDELDFDNLAEKELQGSMPQLHDDLGLDRKSPGLEEPSPFSEDHDTMSGGKGFSSPLSSSPYRSPATGMASPGNQTASPSGTTFHDRELELISSKLDTVKAMLNSIEQRIANVEKAAGVQQKQRLW